MEASVVIVLVIISILIIVFGDWWDIAMMAFIALIMCFSAGAQAGTIGVHTLSRHGTDDRRVIHKDGVIEHKPYNNQNYGLYYIDDSGLIMGAYKNSYDKNTVYAGWTWSSPNWGPLRVSGTLALATGYRTVIGVGVLRPMAMPSVLLDLPLGTTVRWSVAPSTEKGVFQHLSVEWKY